ncbi:hypothetical protein T484DRAFT_1595934, partial [Baffinella frigidus]
CTACPAGSFKDLTGDGACTLCAADDYSTVVASADPAVCLPCPAFTFAVEGSNELTDCTCRVGYTAETNGEACTACGSGTTKPLTGTGACPLCPVATYSGLSALAEDCASCPAATSSPQGSTVIGECSCVPGYTGPNGAACAACPAGTFKEPAGSGVCTAC